MIRRTTPRRIPRPEPTPTSSTSSSPSVNATDAQKKRRVTDIGNICVAFNDERHSHRDANVEKQKLDFNAFNFRRESREQGGGRGVELGADQTGQGAQFPDHWVVSETQDRFQGWSIKKKNTLGFQL